MYEGDIEPDWIIGTSIGAINASLIAGNWRDDRVPKLREFWTRVESHPRCDFSGYLGYTGFKPFGGKLAIEGGYIDVPYTLDEATSSNDILFLERASSQVIAANIAASDFRPAAGARWYTDSFWIGAYATGPTAGAIHSASSTNPNGSTEQLGATARVAGQVVSGKDYSVHIGGDAEFLTDTQHDLVTGAQTLTLSDRPELRIDPTTLVSTGALRGYRALRSTAPKQR